MQDLNVSVIQTHLHWESSVENRCMFEELIANIEETDLIILPEMFTTGFSMNSKVLAEPMDGESMQWLADLSSQKQCAITGSIIIKEGDSFYNRLIFMKPDGQYHSYDKRHLFRMGNEHQHYCEGREKLLVDWMGWRICPLICYDLRFPVWSRNQDEYDLLIYVANWPAKRALAWRSLLVARAIENISFVIGVNRVGHDENHIEYNGGSLIVNMDGDVTYDFTSETVCITQCLSLSALQDYRQRFPAALDADAFTLKL